MKIKKKNIDTDSNAAILEKQLKTNQTISM